jgi:energy-coupling factor transporter ATP-binding protein EcfA2
MGIINGTRWHKCDLHLHTPASKCFRNRDISPKEWVKKAIDEGLSCVAVTDHNTGEWIDEIVEVSKETSLTVFPGVEITCSDAKIHMLILFDVHKRTTDIEDFLIQGGIPRSDFGEANAHTSKNLEDITNLAKACGAIVIPAHIDEFNGISNASYQIRESLFKNNSITSVQLVHSEFLKSSPSQEDKASLKDKLMMYYHTDIGEDRIKSYYSTVKQAVENGKAILTFSDNPHADGDSKHGIWGIGTRYTWIKMDENPNLEGLRQAFLLHDLRIKSDFDSPQVPYETPDLWLESVSIYNSEITGKDKVEYNFSSQMTTIIGGRGTGKSSVIKLLRGVFGKDKDLDTFSSLRTEHSDFFKLKNNKNKKGILKPDTKIEVIFIRNKNRYKITATEFSEETNNIILTRRYNLNIEKWDEEKEIYRDVPDHVEDIIDFFDFTMFSQRQIFEVAQTPNALRDMIDGAIKGLDKLKKNGEETCAKYCEASLKIRRLSTLIKEKGKYEVALNDIAEQISSYQKSGVTELIKKREQFNLDIEKVFKLITKDLNKKENLLHEVTEEFSLNKYDIDRIDDIYQPEINDTISHIYTELVYIKDGLENFKSRITKLQGESRERFSKSTWNKDYNRIDREFEEKKRELK